MIKLQIEDATLATLDPTLLPFVQWKSLKVSDMEGVSDEVLSKYLLKMSRPVIKSLIKNRNISVGELTNDEWYEVTYEMYRDGVNIFEYVQMPYRALMYILEQDYGHSRYGAAMARTQEALPVQKSLEIIGTSSINEVLIKSNLPALRDYMFTEEGLATLKKRNDLRNLVFVTTDEAKVLGLTGNALKNRTISVRLLRRAGACDAGADYCSRILKELNVESITWNEAIKTIRNSPKLQCRPSLLSYMEWIQHNRSLGE